LSISKNPIIPFIPQHRNTKQPYQLEK